LPAADSFALRDFLALALTEAPPDHSTISRMRRLIAVEAHRAVFRWVVQCLGPVGLIKGKTIGLDATPLKASATLRPACCNQPRRIPQSWTAGPD
jgi:transposase